MIWNSEQETFGSKRSFVNFTKAHITSFQEMVVRPLPTISPVEFLPLTFGVNVCSCSLREIGFVQCEA